MDARQPANKPQEKWMEGLLKLDNEPETNSHVEMWIMTFIVRSCLTVIRPVFPYGNKFSTEKVVWNRKKRIAWLCRGKIEGKKKFKNFHPYMGKTNPTNGVFPFFRGFYKSRDIKYKSRDKKFFLSTMTHYDGEVVYR